MKKKSDFIEEEYENNCFGIRFIDIYGKTEIDDGIRGMGFLFLIAACGLYMWQIYLASTGMYLEMEYKKLEFVSYAAFVNAMIFLHEERLCCDYKKKNRLPYSHVLVCFGTTMILFFANNFLRYLDFNNRYRNTNLDMSLKEMMLENIDCCIYQYLFSFFCMMSIFLFIERTFDQQNVQIF